MHQRSKPARLGLVSIVGALVAACSTDSTSVPTAQSDLPVLEPGIELSFVPPGSPLPFTGLAASAVCTAGGGSQPVELPAGYVPTLIATEGPGFPDLPDMITTNETGLDRGRYLYQPHEVTSNGAVSVTDLLTGTTTVLNQRADWERLDGIVWTPWGTLLTGEEAGSAALPDPAVPGALAGLVYEVDPQTGAAVARPAIGSRAHEGLRFDKFGNLYGISETSPGYVYKFVPDRPGDLSSGDLFALKIVEDHGDRTGVGQWVQLDRSAVQVSSDADATAKGATGYARPEDVEIGTSTGNDHRGDNVLYVAITGEDRVLAIDLGVDARGRVTVSDYVRDGINAPADFDEPDNLALDPAGNLYIAEDPGGNAAHGKTQGDDVWFAPFNPASATQSLPVERFLSITDCDAEPTGIYVSPTGKTLFFHLQHRGGSDPRDQTWAIRRIDPGSFAPAAR